ncbi:phospholipase-like protein [Tanacetum coccineum]
MMWNKDSSTKLIAQHQNVTTSYDWSIRTRGMTRGSRKQHSKRVFLPKTSAKRNNNSKDIGIASLAFRVLNLTQGLQEGKLMIGKDSRVKIKTERSVERGKIELPVRSDRSLGGESGTDKEDEEDALVAILKSLVGECKAVYANKGAQIETSSDKTNEVQGVPFVTDDDIQNEEGGILGALPCQLPPKELNPGSFNLPCTIGSLNLYAMTDSGASLTIMPRSIFEHLKLANLKKTDMLVEMANMTKKAPLGIVENVLVKINKFLFPSDFVIMDMLGEPNETMILGRPFLATTHAQIDVFKREISLGIGEDRIFFDMDGNVCHSNIHVEKVYMTNSIQDEEPFNLLRIGDDLFSYESLACLQFEQCTRFCDDESIGTVDSSDNIQEPQVEHKKVDVAHVQSVGGNHMVFSDFLKVRYGNKDIDDTTHKSFDVEIDYGKMRDDPYSRRFDEYKKAFNNEIIQLGNEFDLRIGKKGYALDDVWKKCENFHGDTAYPWHNEGFEEEERWESGIEKTDYEPPFVDIKTFEIKSLSSDFRGLRVCSGYAGQEFIFCHYHSKHRAMLRGVSRSNFTLIL